MRKKENDRIIKWNKKVKIVMLNKEWRNEEGKCKELKIENKIF